MGVWQIVLLVAAGSVAILVSVGLLAVFTEEFAKFVMGIALVQIAFVAGNLAIHFGGGAIGAVVAGVLCAGLYVWVSHKAIETGMAWLKMGVVLIYALSPAYLVFTLVTQNGADYLTSPVWRMAVAGIAAAVVGGMGFGAVLLKAEHILAALKPPRSSDY